MLQSVKQTTTTTTPKNGTPQIILIQIRREMKLVPNNMNNHLFQFDALKFVFEVRLHGGGSVPNFNFSM